MHPATLALLRAPDAPNGSPLSLTEIRTERRGAIVTGTACAADGGCYPIADGILDLLPEHLAVSPAQRSNFVWPTTAFYEQVWRVRSLSLLAGEPFSVNREIGIINRWLRPERGGVFVDVGTSHGLYARNIANRLRQSAATGTIIALDIALPMLQRAGELVARKGYTTINLVRARGQAIPLPDGSVDGVVNGGTFNEMGQQAQALAEVRRVLKPGGCFVCMSLLAGKTVVGRTVQRALHGSSGLLFPTVAETNALYRDAGLAITDQERYGSVLFTRATQD
ncbi:MAG: methyltransferase domain-containing protein [Chloroflexota bacterium]|nr:methyltransferase domain-containing protein [Chloroflexota bacterium]MDQ6907973.1 methyltransferase domain-containing protein [Chloroflexota bacterium]